jgi:hypothetical protein
MAICESNYVVEAGGHDDAPDVAVKGLRYCYDEGGCFYTGPEFGCVHWEAAEG